MFFPYPILLHLDFSTMKNSEQFLMVMLIAKHILKQVPQLVSATQKPIKVWQIEFGRKSLR